MFFKGKKIKFYKNNCFKNLFNLNFVPLAARYKFGTRGPDSADAMMRAHGFAYTGTYSWSPPPASHL
jgi:hypothetical protein